MSFDFKAFLSSVGPAALSFIPGIGPVLSGIAKAAEAVGGNSGTKIQQGLAYVTEGLSEIGKSPLSPEQQVALEKARMETDLELKKLDYQEEKLTYDDQSDARTVIKTALESSDPVVRQARPKMMLLLGRSSVAYTMATPLLLIGAGVLGMEKPLLEELTQMVLWQGATLWGAFTTSFTGYTIARSADKKTQSSHDLGSNVPSILQTASKIGKLVSETPKKG